MTRATAFVLGVCLFGPVGFEPSPEASAQSAPGWATLLDGSNMNQWTPIGNANWRVADGGRTGYKARPRADRAARVRRNGEIQERANPVGM